MEDAGARKSVAMEGAVALKLLCPYSVAGSLIGKAGAVMQEIQTSTGAKIKISQNSEFFPNSQERVVLIQGELEAVEAAVGEVVRRVLDALSTKEESGHVDEATRAAGRRTFKVLIPGTAAGGIIGRAGAVIKQIGEQSACRVTLAPKDQQVPGHNERVMTVSGESLTSVLSAVSLVLRQMQQDPATARYQNMSVSYAPAFPPAGAAFGASPFPGYPGFAASGGAHAGAHHGSAHPAGHAASGHGHSASGASPTEQAMTSMTIPVNEAYVGYIIGKAGSVVQEIMRMSGAQISISQKGEFVEGTTDRILTVTGVPGSVFTAQHIISQKVQQAAASVPFR